MLPASFKDLKALTVSEETLSRTEAHFVNLIQTPITGGDSSSGEELSLESISNIEQLTQPPAPEVRQTQTVPEVHVTSARRQRSGSDVFEMKRPKMTTSTRRKHSGDSSLMRDRTSSLDNTSSAASRPVLKTFSQVRDNDRNRCRSFDSKQSGEEPSKCSTPVDKGPSSLASRSSKRHVTDPGGCGPRSPWPILGPGPPRYGSVALPIYLFDCNIAGLTANLLFKERTEKPKNFYQNHLFKPETQANSDHEETEEEEEQELEEAVKTSEAPCEGGHIDKEIKQRCHIIQTTFFKSFVQVLFRSLQLDLPVHSYDVQHCVDYMDNEGSLDLEMSNFIKAVCLHKEYTTQSRAEDTVTKDMDIKEMSNKSVLVLDSDRIKSNKTCVSLDTVFHTDTKRKFMEILNKQFQQVPSHPDLFFFCPPGLDIGRAHHSSSRKRNETRSSEGTSKYFYSGSSGKIKTDEDEDRTIEFRSVMSEGSGKKESSVTDTGTNVRDGNMSVMSEDMEEEEGEEDEEDSQDMDEFSPPLFIQFSLAISQDKEDIVCAPVKHLPTCLGEIFQVFLDQPCIFVLCMYL